MITLNSGSQYYTAAEYDALRSECDKYLVDMNALRSDANIISEALRSEAIDREWCSLYANFVEEVNSQTSVLKLLQANRDYKVEFTVERKQSATVTVYVTATSDEEAYEIAEDKWDYSSLTDEVSDSDWDDEDYHVDIYRVSEI
jgi:hypothetical protein